jgi:uncharacterized protein (DUF1800 family)
MKPRVMALAVAALLAGCHWGHVKPGDAPTPAPVAPAAAASVAPAQMLLVARPGDINLADQTCGQFMSRITDDAHTHTAEIQTLLTWLFGYASAKNNVDVVRTSAAGPFVDELRADCQADPSQALLPLAVTSARSVINASLLSDKP